MPTTPRGAPYPTLAAANDPPRDFQLLAEWADGQIETLDVATFKRLGVTIAADFTVNSDSATYVGITALDTSFEAVAGRLYRVTAALTTHSTNVQDVAEMRLVVDPGATIGEFPKTANSSPTWVGTSNYHIVTAYWTAPSSGPRTARVLGHRTLGTGTVTFMSDSLKRASLIVEDVGAA